MLEHATWHMGASYISHFSLCNTDLTAHISNVVQLPNTVHHSDRIEYNLGTSRHDATWQGAPSSHEKCRC